MAQADTEIRPPVLGLGRSHCARHDLRDGTRARVRDRGRLLHDAQPASRCSLRAVCDCSRSYVIAAVAAQPWFTRTVAALKPAVSGQTDVSAWAKIVRQCLVDPITVVQDYAPLLATASGRVVVLLACELSAPSPVPRASISTHSRRSTGDGLCAPGHTRIRSAVSPPTAEPLGHQSRHSFDWALCPDVETSRAYGRWCEVWLLPVPFLNLVTNPRARPDTSRTLAWGQRVEGECYNTLTRAIFTQDVRMQLGHTKRYRGRIATLLCSVRRRMDCMPQYCPIEARTTYD